MSDTQTGILSWENGGTVYLRDHASEVSFSVALRSGGFPARARSLPLRIVCPVRSGGVVVVPENEPLVRRFNEHGAVQWSLTIPGFLPLSIEETPTSFARRVPAVGFSQVVAAFALNPTLLVLQVERYRMTDDERLVPIGDDVVFLVDIRTGEIVGHTAFHTRLLGGSESELYFVDATSPADAIARRYTLAPAGRVQ